MKAIILHTASTDNSGARRVAGTELKVGGGKDQIDADRAKGLVSANLAISAGASNPATSRATPRRKAAAKAKPTAPAAAPPAPTAPTIPSAD